MKLRNLVTSFRIISRRKKVRKQTNVEIGIMVFGKMMRLDCIGMGRDGEARLYRDGERRRERGD
jgi:hypothetical protein